MRTLRTVAALVLGSALSFGMTQDHTAQQQEILAGKFYAWFEAEDNSKNDSLQKMNDATASGGKYVWTPDGDASYDFEVERAGTYKVWGRVIALDGRGDSFAVSMDGEKSFKWNDIPHNATWHWDDVHDAAKENKPVKFNLTAGRHILRVKPRDDDNAKLDKIIITDDLTFTSSDAMASGTGESAARKSGAVYLHIEAESGTIKLPFITARDAAASSGSYVWMPDADASYEFNVTAAGRYKVWARVLAPKGSDDSFGVQMDGGKWIKWNNLAHGDAWLWDEVHDSGNEDRVIQFELSPGKHTFRLLQREDGAKLDCLLVTNDMSFIPDGQIPISQKQNKKRE